MFVKYGTKAEERTYTMTEQQFSSNNFYEVLGVQPNASQNEIKRMYQVLALKYHPDKFGTPNMSCNIDKRKDYFYLIDKAWKTLSDTRKRMEYDAMLRDQELNHHWAIDADVNLSDMDFDEEQKLHTWPCRCSGLYEITHENLANGENIICCITCSLTIRVLNYSEKLSSDKY